MPPPTNYSLAATAMQRRATHEDVSQLARAYGTHVFHAAYRVLGDPAQAEDVQQDLFLRLVEKPLPDVANWQAWLRTAATRMAIDRLRRSHRWDRLLPWLRTHAATQAPAPDRATEQRQRADQLREQLARLPRLHAQCFALRVLQGEEIDAIAAQLGITANHARVALHRATQRLERLLGDVATEETTR